MKFGDIIYLSEEKDKKYIVLAVKETNDKYYALITDFNAKIDIKNKKIKDTNIDLQNLIAISSDKETGEIEFVENKNIITELCIMIYKK